jgi:hypothetical protein
VTAADLIEHGINAGLEPRWECDTRRAELSVLYEKAMLECKTLVLDPDNGPAQWALKGILAKIEAIGGKAIDQERTMPGQIMTSGTVAK